MQNFITQITQNGTKYLISQIIGLIAAALLMYSYQMKTHKKILLTQAVSAVFYAIQYILLGQYTGAICNIIGMCRSITYSFRTKSKAVDSIFCPIIFAVLFTISSIFTYTSLYSLLPTFAMIIASFVLWNPTEQKLRIFTLPTSFMWLIYSFCCGSIVSTITEFLSEVSIVISLIRYRKKSKQ